MQSRNYHNNEILRLLVAAGGRCHICNADVMSDWRTGMSINTFEKAHIRSLSDKGSRADPTLSLAERNAASNLLILCSSCHTVIDKKIAEGFYTIEWLLNKRYEKERRIKSLLEVLNDEECLFVKYSSVIDTHNSNFSDEIIRGVCFSYGFFSHDGIINLSEDCNKENIERSIASLDEKFNDRIQRLLDSGTEKTICLFARAPQPLLIYLGTKFNDKHKVNIFTSHRDLEWKFNDTEFMNTFSLSMPEINIKNKVALVLSSTANINENRILDALGENVDIWKISANDIGVDKINNQDELKQFYTLCVKALDFIGEYYGKEKEVNVFPAVCNSLAITFGRAIFTKSHNKINIYDAIRIGSKVKDVFRLSIGG